MLGRLHVMLAGLAFAPSPSDAGAQPYPIELGIDGAVTWNRSDGPDALGRRWTTVVQLPVANLRVGIMSADRRWSMEPNLSLVRSLSKGNSASEMVLDLGLLFHLAVPTPREPRKRHPYIRPFAGVDYVTYSGEDPGGTDARSRLGVGLGAKLPMIDRLSTRLEARYVRTGRSDKRAAIEGFGIATGLSFFTR